MATKTIVCPECGEPVPYGRLACGACGALIAAVAGAPRRSTPLASVVVTEPGFLGDDVVDVEPEAVEPETVEPETVEPETVEPEAAEPEAAEPEAVAPEAAEPEAVAPEAAEPEAAEPAPAEPTAADVAAVEPTPSRPAAQPAATRSARTSGPDLQDWPSDRPFPTAQEIGSRPYEAQVGWEATADGGAPAAAAGPTSAQPGYVAAPQARSSPHPDAAGAYLPPSAAFVTAVTDAPRMGQQAGATGGAATALAALDPSGPSPTSTAKPGPRLRAGDAPILADLPFDAPNSLPGWLTVAGAGVVAIAFFLPWSDLLFGGGQISGSFTDRWGLGNPSHLLVLLAAVSVLGLGLVPNRIAPWIRTGILPIILGGLVLGLVWPYFFASRALFGALLSAAGAILLVIGGIIALRPARHGDDASGV